VGTARAEQLGEAIAACRARLDGVLSSPQGPATLAIRPLADTLCALLYAAVRAQELETFGLDADARQLGELALDHFIDRHVLPTAPAHDGAYLGRIEALSAS
jgi:hypothetical protein